MKARLQSRVADKLTQPGSPLAVETPNSPRQSHAPSLSEVEVPDHLRGSGRNSVSRVDSAGRPFSPRTGLIPTAANETVQLMTKPIDYEQIGMRTFYGALEGGGWHLGHLGLGKYKMDMLFLRQKGNALRHASVNISYMLSR